MGWKGVVLFFLSFLLAISVALTIMGLQGFALLDADTYLPALDKGGFYTNFANQFGSAGDILMRNNESVKLLFETALTSAFDYVNGRTDTLNLTIDLQDEDIRNVVISEIERLPVCDSNESNMPCKPAQLTAEQAYDLAIQQGRIPSFETSIDLGQYINQNGNLTVLREKVDVYRTFVYSVIVISIFLIILIFLIGWKTQSRGLRNVGVPIFLAGFGILVGTYVGFGIALQSIPSFEAFGGSFNPLDVLNEILSGIKARLLISAIILIIVGLVLFVSSFIFKRKEESK